MALVSGGSNGIGRAIVNAFVQAGAQVAIADLDEGLEPTTDERIAFSRCDVSIPSEAKSAVDHCLSAFGDLDILVSGAAVFSPVGPLHTLDVTDWDRALGVNLSGAFHLTKFAIPHFLTKGNGNIILIASQMAQVANAGQAVYCATKGALVQLSKGLALDYAERGIRVNTLSPGGTRTSRLAARFGDLDEAERVWGPKHPMGRLGRPEEIANGAVFLASDASSFMTGADLLLDGGYTAW